MAFKAIFAHLRGGGGAEGRGVVCTVSFLKQRWWDGGGEGEMFVGLLCIPGTKCSVQSVNSLFPPNATVPKISMQLIF